MLYKKYHRNFVRKFKKGINIRKKKSSYIYTLTSDPIIETCPYLPKRITVKLDLGDYVLVNEYGELGNIIPTHKTSLDYSGSLLSAEYFKASVDSYMNSFAGFISGSK